MMSQVNTLLAFFDSAHNIQHSHVNIIRKDYSNAIPIRNGHQWPVFIDLKRNSTMFEHIHQSLKPRLNLHLDL